MRRPRLPPVGRFCANPSFEATTWSSVPLSTWGSVWSYTDTRYQPPPPYVPRDDPFVPFAIVAVELPEHIVVLGQLADGFTSDDVAVGDVVDLVVEPLDARSGGHGDVASIWRWRPRRADAARRQRGDRPRRRPHRRCRHAPVGQVG